MSEGIVAEANADDAAEVEEAPAGGGHTGVGGYAQLQAEWLAVGPDPTVTGTASVRRLVLFVAHDFSHWNLPIRTLTELEWEHAIAGDGQPGSVEVEQAWLAWDLAGPALALRAGLVLVPMGIVNLVHEPPAFHGVDRPRFDQTVIPSTWRELGAGLTGSPGHLRYEVYVLTALDPSGLDDRGIVGGRALGALAPARAAAFSGRLEVEPRWGWVAGVSGYGSDAGPAGEWYDATGHRLDLSLPVVGVAAHARARHRGFEFRAVGAHWWLPESDDLMEAHRADGSPYFPEGSGTVPTRIGGGYVELAWNVLHLTASDQELLPFARLEHYDTQLAVPEGWEANPLRTVDEATFGLTYRPVPAVAFKGDVQFRDRRYGDDEIGWSLGVGWMF